MTSKDKKLNSMLFMCGDLLNLQEVAYYWLANFYCYSYGTDKSRSSLDLQVLAPHRCKLAVCSHYT